MRAKRSIALHDLNHLLDEPGSAGRSHYIEKSFLDLGGGRIRRRGDRQAKSASAMTFESVVGLYHGV